MRSIECEIQADFLDPAVNNTRVLPGAQMLRIMNKAEKEVVL
jgi:hypothetical protein